MRTCVIPCPNQPPIRGDVSVLVAKVVLLTPVSKS